MLPQDAAPTKPPAGPPAAQRRALLGSAALVGLTVAGGVWLVCTSAASDLDRRAGRNLATHATVLQLSAATEALAVTAPRLDRTDAEPARQAVAADLNQQAAHMASLAASLNGGGLNRDMTVRLRRAVAGMDAALDDFELGVEMRAVVNAELHAALARIPERQAALRDTLAALGGKAADTDGPHLRDAIDELCRVLAERLAHAAAVTDPADLAERQAAFRSDARALEATLQRLPIAADTTRRFEAARQLVALGLEAGNVFDLRREQLHLAAAVTERLHGTRGKAAVITELARWTAKQLDADARGARLQSVLLWYALPAVSGLAAALSVLAAVSDRHPSPPAPSPAAAGPDPVRREVRILLAEDEPMTRMVATTLLRGAGYAVTVVENGRAALDAAAAQPFDLVLLDLRMPEMDGLEALRCIRALPDPDRAGVRVAVLTASAVPEDAEQCRAAGADAVLPKPLRLDTLPALLDCRPADAPAATGDEPVFDPGVLEPMLEALPAERVAALAAGAVRALHEYHAALTAAWHAGDGAAAAAMAHKIAGVAGVYGCLALRKAAQALERCLEGGGADPVPLVAALEAARHPALAALERHCGTVATRAEAPVA